MKDETKTAQRNEESLDFERQFGNRSGGWKKERVCQEKGGWKQWNRLQRHSPHLPLVTPQPVLTLEHLFDHLFELESISRTRA